MAKKIEHLLLTTLEDPYDQKSWSGIPYSLRSALEKQVPKLTVVSKLKPRRHPKDVMLRVLLGGNPPRYPLWMTHSALNGFAQEVSRTIRHGKPDAVLSISSQCLIKLKQPDLPLFMFVDAPWLAWKRAYSRFEGMPIPGPRFARLEGKASQNWSGVVLGSNWAVGQAKELYSIPSDRLHAVHLGANWTPGVSRDVLMRQIKERSRDCLELLYVGKDWERKGGPLAVEVARVLHERGINVRLHVVGCRPTLTDAEAFVTMHGLLRQDNDEDKQKMEALFLRSHFLLVPTLAECFGIVFAEAQSFGLPPVSRSIHALPSVVLNGKTGILLPENAAAPAYADRILEAFTDQNRYEMLARSARDYYESTLNWNHCASRILQVMEDSRQ